MTARFSSMRWFWKFPQLKIQLDGTLDFSQASSLRSRPAAADKRGVKFRRGPAAVQLRGRWKKPVATVEFSPVARQENSSDDNSPNRRIAHNMPWNRLRFASCSAFTFSGTLHAQQSLPWIRFLARLS